MKKRPPKGLRDLSVFKTRWVLRKPENLYSKPLIINENERSEGVRVSPRVVDPADEAREVKQKNY
jgi:hypothetical protein